MLKSKERVQLHSVLQWQVTSAERKFFDPEVEEWSTYVERLEMFFVVNNVPNEKKAASLLTLIGGKMYALLKS